MPCNCDGFDDIDQYDSQNTSLEKKWHEQEKCKESLCKLLTIILFETFDKELVKNIKEQASRLTYWYREHLYEDIKKCENRIQEYNLSFKFEEREKWEVKRTSKIALLEKIKKIIEDDWK